MVSKWAFFASFYFLSLVLFSPPFFFFVGLLGFIFGGDVLGFLWFWLVGWFAGLLGF